MLRYLLFLLIPLSLELAARIYTGQSGGPVDQALGLLRSDANLGWRTRSSLDTRFFSAHVKTDSSGFRIPAKKRSEAKPDRYEMWTFGPSSAFGWGVEAHEAYPHLLAELLGRGTIHGRNLGQIGYTVFQGRKLLHENKPPPGSLVVLSYGLNELDRFRFFFPAPVSDRQFFSAPIPWAQLAAANLGASSHALRYLTRGASLLRRRVSCPLPPGLPLRASTDEYLHELDAFVQELHANGSRIILVNTPYRPDPPSLTGEKSDAVYARAVEAASNGRCRESSHLMDRFFSLETGRIREGIRTFNTDLGLWARTHGLPLVEASRLLSSQEDFFDPVHPSATGHRKIAEAIAAMARKQSTGLLRSKSGTEPLSFRQKAR